MGLTYSAFQTDSKMETAGVVLDFGDAGKFRVARAGGSNKRFNTKMMSVTKPHRHAIDQGTLDDSVATALFIDVYAETVVMSWEGVTGPDGQTLEFNKANVVKLLTDLPDLFTSIRRECEKAANFRAEALESDAKN